MSPARKPVKLQPLYRVESDDEMPSQRTIIVDDEPEEEVVHVVHRQRPKPKEKVIYVEEESAPVAPQATTKNIVYVDPPQAAVSAAPTTTYMYSAKPSVIPQHTQVLYATQAPPPPTQVIYQQPPPPQQQIVYTTTGSTGVVPIQYVMQEQPQYAYISDPATSSVIYYTDPSAVGNLVPATNIIYR